MALALALRLREPTIRRRLLATGAALLMLAACGGGGGEPGPAYALVIDGPAQVTTAAASLLLTGSGFLPPGSTCPGGCDGLLPPPVFGRLGAHTLTWSNAATGESGEIGMSWVCNCGGGAPMWMKTVALAVGANAITVTESAAGHVEQAVVTVTRTAP